MRPTRPKPKPKPKPKSKPKPAGILMNNRQLAETFILIANLSEIKGEVIYKTLAYRKAAESLMALGREAGE